MINDYLFRKLTEQYENYIPYEKLEIIYKYELSEFEEMVIFAYKTDVALKKINDKDNELYDEVTRGNKFKWIESWRAKTHDFKYIQDYLDHLKDVITNCENYIDEKGILNPIPCEKYIELSERDKRIYNSAMDIKEVSPVKKGKYKSLIK